MLRMGSRGIAAAGQRSALTSTRYPVARLLKPTTTVSLRRLVAIKSGSSDEPSGDEPGSSPKAPIQLLEGEDGELQMPKEVIERMKSTVFGYDTMWVTSVENYSMDGVVFKGNIRSKDIPGMYQKLCDRMKNELGDGYRLFLVEDKDEKPTAVVLPRSLSDDGRITKFTEVWLTVLFAIMTALTTLNANNVPILQFALDPYGTELNIQDVYDAIPGSLALWFALGSHEWGHFWAAGRRSVQLYYPFIIPAGFGFLGSFGGLTRVRGFIPNREAMLDIAVHGPLIGTIVASSMTLLGFVLTSAGFTDYSIDTVSFSDSLIMGVGAQLFFQEGLNNPEIPVNSLLIAGWSALVFNALNCIPTGELDGGRITLAIFGRRPASLFSVLTLLALGLTSLNSTLSFYWVILILLLQRGPIMPCEEELSVPTRGHIMLCEEELSVPTDKKTINYGLALLALPLLLGSGGAASVTSVVGRGGAGVCARGRGVRVGGGGRACAWEWAGGRYGRVAAASVRVGVAGPVFRGRGRACSATWGLGRRLCAWAG
eukprot:gene6603-3257_t